MGVVVAGFVLGTAVCVWASRRILRARKRSAGRDRAARQAEAQLRLAADMVIAERRRTGSALVRVPILVSDVQAKAYDHFRLTVPRWRAAEALRESYERWSCRFDCTTDAYDLSDRA